MSNCQILQYRYLTNFQKFINLNRSGCPDFWKCSKLLSFLLPSSPVPFLGHPHYNNNSKNAPTFPNFEKFLVSHKNPIFCTISKTPKTFQPIKIASYKYFWDALYPRARLESHTRIWSINFMFFENIRNVFCLFFLHPRCHFWDTHISIKNPKTPQPFPILKNF
jgi:hypothetical protein